VTGTAWSVTRAPRPLRSGHSEKARERAALELQEQQAKARRVEQTLLHRELPEVSASETVARAAVAQARTAVSDADERIQQLEGGVGQDVTHARVGAGACRLKPRMRTPIERCLLLARFQSVVRLSFGLCSECVASRS
jgi:hypothetical protein